MKISITGKQLDIGDALKTHIEDNLTDSITKYFDSPIQAAVAVAKEGSGMHVDISAHPCRGIVLQGTATEQDPYAAFDKACERIAKQLRRYKRRLKAHKGKGESEEAQLSVIAKIDNDTEITEDDGAPTIVAEMTSDIPLCSVSGAVMRMDLADSNAIMFRNSAHGGMNMIYRRRDGNIGWVDPQAS